MPFEIVELLDEMPKGRVRRTKVDKYAAFTDLLDQIPEGKVAQLALPRDEYRAFSSAIRAAGERGGKKVHSVCKGTVVYVSWEPLTEEHRSKRRGRQRTG